MNTRDLLEKAAKAVGYKLEWDGNICQTYDYHSCGSIHLWNPLENDGDVFCLQVILRLTISINQNEVVVFNNMGDFLVAVPVFGKDERNVLGSARLAVTRAAAAMWDARQENEK